MAQLLAQLLAQRAQALGTPGAAGVMGAGAVPAPAAVAGGDHKGRGVVVTENGPIVTKTVCNGMYTTKVVRARAKLAKCRVRNRGCAGREHVDNHNHHNHHNLPIARSSLSPLLRAGQRHVLHFLASTFSAKT